VLSTVTVGALLLTACIDPVTVPVESEGTPLAVGARRQVVLRDLRMNVRNFEHTLTLNQLKGFARETLDSVWLLDLDLTPLVQNSLVALRDATPESLPSAAARNMQRLLATSANVVDLSRTVLDDLIQLSGSIGIPPAQAVADLMQIGRADPVIPIPVAAAALVQGLVASHPSGQWRNGLVDAEHPDGRHPVTPGAVPITLADVVDEFAQLTARFGPALTDEGLMHPGFIVEAMRVRANANALPYKGLDLSLGEVASVNSLGTQIDTIFDTTDPQWLQIEGLIERPTVKTLTVRVTESQDFFGPATQRAPAGEGDNSVWQQPPWVIERMVAEMARTTTRQKTPQCVEYTVGDGTVVFEGCLDDTGWLVFDTFNDVGNRPDPTYLWDIQLEMAQVRLHDGDLLDPQAEPIAEGNATVEFTLNDLPVGVDSVKLLEEIKVNMAKNPRALRDLASAINQTTEGAADIFYVRIEPEDDAVQTGDWLWFVTEDDIPRLPDGARERPFAYAQPGFFADAALTQPVGDRRVLFGDDSHTKVAVAPGMVLYLQDDTGAVFELRVGPKPERRRLALDLTRLR
jgi:hypothetical protein